MFTSNIRYFVLNFFNNVINHIYSKLTLSGLGSQAEQGIIFKLIFSKLCAGVVSLTDISVKMSELDRNTKQAVSPDITREALYDIFIISGHHSVIVGE